MRDYSKSIRKEIKQTKRQKRNAELKNMLRIASKRLKHLSYSTMTMGEHASYKIESGMSPKKAGKQAYYDYIHHSTANPERRLDKDSNWEYRCEKCKKWKKATKFGKRLKPRKVLLDHYCITCTARLKRKEAEAKIRGNASNAYRRSLLKRSLHLKNEIETFYAESVRRERQTGIEHHVDHIVPVNHELVCGLHVPCNLQVLTAEANWEKSNNFIPYYEDRSGRIILLDEGSPCFIKGSAKKDKPPRQIKIIKAKDRILIAA